MVIENNVHTPAAPSTSKDEPNPKDVYAELLKLDDLRKRGSLVMTSSKRRKGRS